MPGVDKTIPEVFSIPVIVPRRSSAARNSFPRYSHSLHRLRQTNHCREEQREKEWMSKVAHAAAFSPEEPGSNRLRSQAGARLRRTIPLQKSPSLPCAFSCSSGITLITARRDLSYIIGCLCSGNV